MTKKRNSVLKEVGPRLKRVRETMEYSQERMAALFGVTRSTYCRYEAGNAFPGASGLELLVSYFNVSPDWLMTGIGEMYLQEDEQSPANLQLEDLKPDVQGMVKVMKKMPLICFEVLSFYYAFKLDNPHVFQLEQACR